MKTIRLFATAIIIVIGISKSAAQVSVNVNIGAPPAWAPVGYETAEYYYLPDVESYYDVRASRFIYFGNGQWVRTRYLPRPYRHYDLYNGYKVVLTDYHGPSPYVHFKEHKVKYYKGFHGPPQHTIGVRPVKRVAVMKEHGHGNGHGHGKG
ncbi:MAG TPA: hypothetical protein VK528_08075, partial [Flavobacterium sp.]|nr:hypothetical protein [Flavobacterium sp.]